MFTNEFKYIFQNAGNKCLKKLETNRERETDRERRERKNIEIRY